MNLVYHYTQPHLAQPAKHRLSAKPNSLNKLSLFVASLFIIFAASSGGLPAWGQTLDFAGGAGGATRDVGEDLAVDAQGNIYITGLFEGTADFDFNAGITNLVSQGDEDIFVAKYDPEGYLQWAVSAGGSGIDFGHGISVDHDGNVLVTGDFAGTVDFDPGPGITNVSSQGQGDIFTWKLDASGNLVWAFGFGSSVDDGAHDIDVDGAGNVYITGGYEETVDFDPGPGIFNMTSTGDLDIYLAKYDPQGNFLWAFTSEGGGDANQRGWALDVDAAGNSHIAGWFKGAPDVDPGPGQHILTSNGLSDIWLGKYDTNGSFLWAFNVGSTSRDQGMSVSLDAEGNCYLTGFFRNSADFDPGPGDHTLVTKGPQEAFVAKYSANGAFIWAIHPDHTDPSSHSQGMGISSDPSGNTIFTGLFYKSMDVDPGSGIATVSGPGANDVFLVSYDPQGNLLWGEGFGGTNSDIGTTAIWDATGHALMTGQFQATANFSADAGTPYNLTSNGISDVFVAKYQASSNPSPVASFIYQANDLSVDFDGSGSSDDGAVVEWAWDFGDGSSGTGSLASHAYASPGVYSVSLTVTDDEGATGLTSQLITIGNQPPAASFSYIASELTVDFDGNGSSDDGAVVEWAWDFGDGSSGSGSTVSHSYAASGTYTVTLTVTDDEGVTGSLSQQVTVTEAGNGTMHVASITTVTIRAGGSAYVDATILIADANGAPVETAMVTGTFSGDVSGSGTETTAGDGTVVLSSNTVNVRPRDFNICVNTVTHATLTYDPSANSDPGYTCSAAAPSEAKLGPDSISPLAESPATFVLHANYPNPFNPSTTITFDLPEASYVQLEVYDIMGRRMTTLIDGQRTAGRHEAIWYATSDKGTPVAGGVYLYKIQTGSFRETRQMVLLK